jgi:tetratricopeptide (TPR) repeat protein
MFRKKTIALSMCGLFSMVGCSSTSDQANWRIDPLYGVKHSSETPKDLYRLGQYYKGRVRYDQAIAAYKAALERDPGFADAHNGLGVVYARQGRYEEAIREFQNAITIAPQSAYFYNNLGYAYLLQGSNERAMKTLEEAQRLDPSNKKVMKNLKLARKGEEQSNTNNVRKPAVAEASTAPKAQSTQVVVGKSSNAQTNVALVAVAPNVYELQEPRSVGASEVAAISVDLMGGNKNPVAQPKPFGLEVSNGNGITGMARQVAERLESSGVKTVHLTNQLPFQQASTEIQYREGYLAEAMRLSTIFQVPVLVVYHEALRSDIHLRVVLGRDVSSEAALVGSRGSNTQIAEIRPFRLEVSNGNGVTGLAGRVATRLNHVGVQTALLTNQRPFDQATTEIQYRDGYRAAATGLNHKQTRH